MSKSETPTPLQSRAEATLAVARLGDVSRAVARIEVRMNDRIAAIKNTAEGDAEPLRLEAIGLMRALETWCSDNRDALTDGGKVKSADLGTGTVGWRLRPPKVTLRKVEALIDEIRKLRLHRFLRVSYEVNKDAMLADPERARKLAGVKIGSAGEDFYVEPFEAALEETAP